MGVASGSCAYARPPPIVPLMRASRLAWVFVLAGCGGGEVLVSNPIALDVGGIKEGDIRNEAYNRDKSITSDSGNPFKQFLEQAKGKLDGKSPGRIGVEKIVITVDGSSKGIGSQGLATILKNVQVYVEKDATVALTDVEEVPQGATLELPVTAGEDELKVMQTRMLASDFKVGIRGDAVSPRPQDFDLKVNVQITFAAYE